MSKAKHIYLIAGEASGDFLGAQLMQALKEQNPDIKFSGVGGPLMQSHGLKSLFPMEELSVMGIWEVLPRLMLILKRIKQTIQNIVEIKPDIIVSIDAPDFSFRVLKGVKKLYAASPKIAPKLVHYVAPTVWAWRPKRAIKIAKFLDAIICLFKFEPPYFEEVGIKSIAVGHPMMESGIVEATPAVIGDAESRSIGVFFGSRQGEIRRISPVLIDTIEKIKLHRPNIDLVIPTLPHLEDQIEFMVKPLDIAYCISSDRKDKWSIFKACDVAIAVSGTVGLELAAANVPHVIAYKMNALTAFFVRRMIKTPFAHLANIIMRQEVVPEFIQENCTAENISKKIVELLDEESLRDKQKISFESVRQSIGGETPPSKAAAEFLLKL